MFFQRRSFLKALGMGMVAGTMPASLPAVGQVMGYGAGPSRPQERVTRLNCNENAYGPSSQVQARLQETLAGTNRYPAGSDELIARLAAMHRVSEQGVLLGCGSTELIRILAAGLLGPGKSVITASPTYEAMAEYSRVYGGQTIAIRLDHEFAHDLDKMLARVDSQTALVYICNPNNPTGSITTKESINQFLEKLPATVVVVVDEAYYQYAPYSPAYESLLDRPVADPRLVVLRTFSAVYGLAGLRIGYAVMSPQLATRLRPQLTENGVSDLGLQGALASLDDEEGLRFATKRNADARVEFSNQAIARMLKPIDTKANFVMMNVNHPAAEVVEQFRRNHVLIGGPYPPMNTFIRVSLGTPQDMVEFWRVWDLLPYARDMKM